MRSQVPVPGLGQDFDNEVLCVLHVPEPPAAVPHEGGVPVLLHPDDGVSGHGEIYSLAQTFLQVGKYRVTQ